MYCLFDRHHLSLRIRPDKMVIHRFAIDRRQIETAGVDSTKIDTDRHLLSGRQIVNIAVSTIVTNILVIDTCHLIVNRVACKEARVQYLPQP